MLESDGWFHVRTKGSHRQLAGENEMRYLVVVEEGSASFGAYVPDLPGCSAAGETKDEALALIREAIELHLEDLKNGGQPIPRPSSVSEVVEVQAV